MALKYLVLMVLMFGPTAWASQKTLCLQTGDPHDHERIQKAVDEWFQCLISRYQFKSIPSNREDVFKKFKESCSNMQEANKCWDQMIKDINSCYNEKLMEYIQTTGTVIRQAAEFVCYDHAERIRKFSAEGGLECLGKKSSDIIECLPKLEDNSVASFLRKGKGPFGFGTKLWIKIEPLPYDDDQCDVYKKLEECIVDHMKSCKSSTPADLVESLFEEAFKGTPCGDKLSIGLNVLIAVILLAIVVLLIVVSYKKKVCCKS